MLTSHVVVRSHPPRAQAQRYTYHGCTHHVQAQRWRIIEKIKRGMGKDWRQMAADDNQGRLELVSEIVSEDGEGEGDGEDDGEGEGEGEEEEGEGEGGEFTPFVTCDGMDGACGRR